MLDNLKSSFIFKKVFSYINELIKLKLVKYNKYVQTKLDIDIINYMHYQGKYIIYETKTKGKEYNYKDELKYEGGFLNGERNGKGKEYDKRRFIIYEGEYLKGKRNWKGKEYIHRYLYLFMNALLVLEWRQIKWKLLKIRMSGCRRILLYNIISLI